MVNKRLLALALGGVMLLGACGQQAAMPVNTGTPVASQPASGTSALGLYELHIRSVDGHLTSSVTRVGGGKIDAQGINGLTFSAAAAATSEDATSKHYTAAITVSNSSGRDINQPLYVPVAVEGYTQSGTFFRNAKDSSGSDSDPVGVTLQQADATTPLVPTSVSPSLFNVPAGMTVTSVSSQAWQASSLPNAKDQTVTFGFDIPKASSTYSFSVVFGVFATPAVDHVVISEVYGGGGNAGATYTNDFIELFNPTNGDIDLSNYSVQYASATGTTWQATKLSGKIAPGQYYLVQQAKGTGGTTPLPTPDAIGTIAMGGGSGQIILASQATPVSGANDAAMVDYIKYAASNTTSFSRSNVCVDTGASSDFIAGSATPMNAASPSSLCQ